MADFVAVIRRAVDGLAKNTPEMREKVYEKARGAVRRQLENMKPAPPETMIHRQMDKLEAAILSVEAEHAEALPAEEAVAAPAFAPEPVYDEVPVAEPTEPEVYEPEAVVPAQWPEEASAAPAVVEDAYVPAEEPDVARQDSAALDEERPFDGAGDQQYEQVHAVDERADDQSYQPSADVDHVEEPWRAGDENRNYEEPEPLHHYPEDTAAEAQASPEPIGLWPSPEAEQPEPDAALEPYAAKDDTNWVSPEPDPEPIEAAQTSWASEPVAAPPVNEDAWQWPEEVPQQPQESWQGVPDLPGEAGSTTAPDSVEAHFEEQTYAGASSVRMPSTEDFPPFDHVVAAEEEQASAHQTFDDELHNPVGVGAAGSSAASDAAKDPWEDIEGLIGYNQNAMPAGHQGQAAADMDADGDMMPPPPRPYRVAPKKRNYTAPILALIGLIIVAAGGYGLWLNRDSLTELVGFAEPSEATAPATDTPQAPAETAQAPEAEAPVPAEPAPDGGAAAPAAEEVASTPKFTQRLLANGTEVDEGAGPAEAAGAGQSVAQLNAPPATPAENGAEAGAAPAGPAEPSATPADAAALAGEKMFLYEERVGQTAPTAIEGAVAWSLQREASAGGAQEPVVQGRVNVPGRGLTALITFKRNTDASLPASHLIEIVFAVPPGFEGGAIDSVQRIAMKQTEQDRGDALIAVPAKITDDFHMIALNDFPDARTTNLELLRSRNWMDVPLAYRNGRRALLTLQKGEEGMRAFNDAIREWQALSSNGNNGQ